MANSGSTGNDSVGSGTSGGYQGTFVEQGFKVDFLLSLVNDATQSAKNKLDLIKARRSAVSPGDMFDMQMLMNRLSQLSEMTTAVINASHQAINSAARGIKG